MTPGTTLEGRYRLIRLLGEGGMGAVWLAQDLTLDKQVALKTLLPKMVADARAVAQLKKEVRISQELRHPCICATYDFHDHGDHPFLVMEYVDGETLSNYIFRQPGHRLPESQFMGLATQILDAVGHAHSAGVIHRDLKSGNIMVTRSGAVRVMDFGIAASLKETHSRTTGTPVSLSIHYASPEQINGEAPSVGMDIYSLGCVFHEMLAGEPPFRQGDILYQQLTRPPEPVAGVSAEVNRVILACLVKDPKKRLKSAAEVAAALQGDRTIKLRAPTTGTLPRPHSQTNWLPWIWSGVGVLVLAGAGVVFWQVRQAGEPPRPSPAVVEGPAAPPATPEPTPAPAAQPPEPAVEAKATAPKERSQVAEAARHLARGIQLQGAFDYAKAVEEFKIALRLEPGNAEAGRRLRDTQAAWDAERAVSGVTTFDAAEILRQAKAKHTVGQYQEAIQLYQSVLQRDPGNRAARQGVDESKAAQEAERKALGQ